MIYPPVAESLRESKDDLQHIVRTQRVPMLRPVQIQIDNKVIIGEVMDIGEDGLRLRCGSALDVSTPVLIHLSLPASAEQGARRCTLAGQVMWTKGAVAGIKFSNPQLAKPKVQALLEREEQARVA